MPGCHVCFMSSRPPPSCPSPPGTRCATGEKAQKHFEHETECKTRLKTLISYPRPSFCFFLLGSFSRNGFQKFRSRLQNFSRSLRTLLVFRRCETSPNRTQHHRTLAFSGNFGNHTWRNTGSTLVESWESLIKKHRNMVKGRRLGGSSSKSKEEKELTGVLIRHGFRGVGRGAVTDILR